MSRIGTTFEDLQKKGRKALVIYIMAGDPDADSSLTIAEAAVEGGADILEFGMPFSDPVADGPVIQRAGQRSLAGGMTLKRYLQLATRLRERVDCPIVHMGSINPIFRYGMECFCQDAADAGIDGLIVPDLPADEALGLYPLAEAAGIDPIMLLAPTSGEDRMRMVCAFGGGFAYYVSRLGITGEQQTLAPDLADNLKMLRSVAGMPVAVGFGISNRDQAVVAAEHADGIIIGSALVRLVEEHGANAPDAVREFVRPIAEALHGV